MEQSKYLFNAACCCRLSKDDENDGTNEICLIMSDGSRVPMLISSANGSYNGGNSATGTIRLYFAGESDNTVRYIDVSKGRTIYINGVEYKIKQQY